MPDRSRVGWRFIVTIILIVTCLLTLASMGRPGAPAFPMLHDRQTVAWVTWIILAPGVIAAARRIPFGDGTPFRWLWRHVVLGSAFSLAGLALATAITLVMRTAPHDMIDTARTPFTASFASGLLVYMLIAVSYQAIAYYRTARDQEAVATRLRADLAEARLATLEGQLHPHFLFNALNS